MGEFLSASYTTQNSDSEGQAGPQGNHNDIRDDGCQDEDRRLFTRHRGCDNVLVVS